MIRGLWRTDTVGAIRSEGQMASCRNLEEVLQQSPRLPRLRGYLGKSCHVIPNLEEVVASFQW
jgi:hypothetical protein